METHEKNYYVKFSNGIIGWDVWVQEFVPDDEALRNNINIKRLKFVERIIRGGYASKKMAEYVAYLLREGENVPIPYLPCKVHGFDLPPKAQPATYRNVAQPHRQIEEDRLQKEREKRQEILNTLTQEERNRISKSYIGAKITVLQQNAESLRPGEKESDRKRWRDLIEKALNLAELMDLL